jgi:hypothetical protein
MKKTKLILLLWVSSFLLTSCTHNRIRYVSVLNQAEHQNANYDSITNLDSIKIAVKFMDSNGSSNERMRAHYLLGCAYRDMGEAPRALESYQNAADCADTTNANCDFLYLMKIHSQMADLFYKQLLPFYMLDELDLQYKYALMANKKIFAINAIERKAGPYELLGMPDSIIQIRETAYRLYKQNGFNKEAALAVGPIIILLIEKGYLEKAKQYMDIYEEALGIAINGYIDKSRIIYYYTKGNYYLAKEKPDSAKIFFQMLVNSSIEDEQLKAGYRGLYLLYKNIGQKDSLAKYSNLCYILNDACYASKATEKMRQMQALYNYTRSQKEANTMKAKADHNWLLFLATSLTLVLVLAIGSYFYQIRRKEIDILYIQYENTKANLEKAKREQKKMEEENNNLLEEKNQEILIYEQQVRDYEAKLKIERKKVTNEELMESHIYKHMKDILTYQKEKMYNNDWKELRNMINEKIPCFYSETHANKAGLQEKDYDLCILIRLYFTPSEIAALTDLSSSNISMKRIRLLKKIYGIDGSPEDFDKRIRSIF